MPSVRAPPYPPTQPSRLRTHPSTHAALFPAQVPLGSVHALTLVFVLSAMSPDTMPAAVRHCAAALAPGGKILARSRPCLLLSKPLSLRPPHPAASLTALL